MAEAESRSITRRELVAGSAAAVPAALATCLPAAAAPHGEAGADPVYAAISAHAHAYAADDAQLKDDCEDDVALEPLIDAEHAAADAFAATVPTTLAGAAAALAHVRLLHERDNYPLLDDFYCYVFIASTETAVRRALDDSRTA